MRFYFLLMTRLDPAPRDTGMREEATHRVPAPCASGTAGCEEAAHRNMVLRSVVVEELQWASNPCGAEADAGQSRDVAC